MSSQISMNPVLLNVSLESQAARTRSGDDLNTDTSIAGPSPAAGFNTVLSTSPLNGLGDHGPRNVQPSASNISNITEACPSPDEIIIKGRGRRSLPVKWSPISIESPKKLPPIFPQSGRSPKKGLIALRSSPRKRLQLSDASSSELASNRKALLNTSPLARKQAGTVFSSKLSLESIISSLSQSQLVNMLNTVIQSHPEIKDEVLKMLPDPCMKLVEEQLTELQKSLIRALQDCKTDSSSFYKVMPHLSALKKLISEQCQMLSNGEQWSALIEFIGIAWPYVRTTPMWDAEVHLNYARIPCFKILAQHSLEALQRIDVNDIHDIESLSTRLESFSSDHRDLQSSVELLHHLRES